MIPAFTYPELQQRFCEGFAFYPFKALEQHGGFIYKSYQSTNDMPRLLEQYGREYDFNILQAQKLLRKLQQHDIPVTGELLYRLQITSRQLEDRFKLLKRQPSINRQLLETMDTYHRLLAVYQHDVQQRIAAQLATVPEAGDEDAADIVSAEHIKKLQAVVQEFTQSTEVMALFLKGCINGKRKFNKMALTVDELENMHALIRLIAQVRNLQDRNFCMLEEWKQQVVLFQRRHTMN